MAEELLTQLASGLASATGADAVSLGRLEDDDLRWLTAPPRAGLDAASLRELPERTWRLLDTSAGDCSALRMALPGDGEAVVVLAGRHGSEIDAAAQPWLAPIATAIAQSAPARLHQLLVENARELLYVQHEDGSLVYVSPSCEALTGYTQAEYLANPAAILDWNSPLTRSAQKIWNQLQKGIGPVPIYRVGVIHRDGSRRIHEVRDRWVHTPGEPRLLVGVAIDVTEQDVLERHLARAQRTDSLGRMAAGIAHNFNNALTIISSLAEFGRTHTEPADEMHEVFADILAGSGRAGELVRQLLTYAKAPAATLKRTTWQSILADSEAMLRGLVTGSQVSLEIDGGDDELSIVVDRSLMEQVLINLVQNAEQAMDSGRIWISADHILFSEQSAPPQGAAGEYARLTVADDGPGIAPSLRANIFDPFFTTRPEGTGLGLASVQSLVDQCGGFVLLRSEVGEGTAFEVYVPVAG